MSSFMGMQSQFEKIGTSSICYNYSCLACSYRLKYPGQQYKQVRTREKNNFPFYSSRLQAIFARSGGAKILKRARYFSGFATPGANKANPNPGA